MSAASRVASDRHRSSEGQGSRRRPVDHCESGPCHKQSPDLLLCTAGGIHYTTRPSLLSAAPPHPTSGCMGALKLDGCHWRLLPSAMTPRSTCSDMGQTADDDFPSLKRWATIPRWLFEIGRYLQQSVAGPCGPTACTQQGAASCMQGVLPGSNCADTGLCETRRENFLVSASSTNQAGCLQLGPRQRGHLQQRRFSSVPTHGI